MQNYQVGKEPDYLQMNVFSRTNKGNIIHTRQNNKPLVYGHFGANSILSHVYFLDFLKDFRFTFSYKKNYKKSLPTYLEGIEEVTAKTIFYFFFCFVNFWPYF